MKKICIVALIIALLLCACAVGPGHTLDTEYTTGEVIADVMTISASDLETYNKLIATYEGLPEGFVTWEQIKELGEFYSFVTVDNGYLYSIKRADGYNRETLGLYIYHHPYAYRNEKTTEISLIEDMTKEMSDMLRIPNKGLVEIKRNGYAYHYNEGGLFLISWEIDGVVFLLCDVWKVYSAAGIPEGTLMSRLLSVSEAESDAAFAELKLKLEKE